MQVLVSFKPRTFYTWRNKPQSPFNKSKWNSGTLWTVLEKEKFLFLKGVKTLTVLPNLSTDLTCYAQNVNVLMTCRQN